MKIGIFGGSFDPVHKEHVAAARAAIACLDLDKLFVVPARKPPHKPSRVLTSNADRLEMCRLGFAEVPKTEVCDYELSQEETSYTYLTCRYFRERFPEAELFWLVGTDMLRDFPTWRCPEEILKNVTLAVCGRNEKDDWQEAEQASFWEKFGKNFARVTYNGADVSSTRIRVLAGAGMRLTEYTPAPVAAYIGWKGLYKLVGAQEALALESETRRAHSLRVAETAASRALSLRIPERTAVQAALLHDCAKNLAADSPYLVGFFAPSAWGEVPPSVLHQFAGAYVAEKYLGVNDEDVLNAVRYHTSGRPAMSELEKLIFLSDMLEDGRAYEGVDELRRLFWGTDGLDACLREALRRTIEFLKERGATVYPLTRLAEAYYKKTEVLYGGNNE